jgi:hypothetical protein
MLITARLIGDTDIGTLSKVDLLYISEISLTEFRSTLLVLEKFSIVSGVVIDFWNTCDTHFTENDWAWMMPLFLQIVPAFVLGTGIYFLPFSPWWLISKGRSEEAQQKLTKLRRVPGSSPQVKLGHLDIEAEVLILQENECGKASSTSIWEQNQCNQARHCFMAGRLQKRLSAKELTWDNGDVLPA